MKIVDHLLKREDGASYPFMASPNVGDTVQHEFLVMHFTAGRSAESSVRWLTKPEARASAHLVIGRDGSITQLVPFDKIAWHAGRSRWGDRVGLNRYSLGIELDNAGRLSRTGNQWKAWFGRQYPEEEVVVAVHKNETTSTGWHTYTEEQLEAALEVSSLLVTHYGLRDIVGHDDIAPGRKNDPGPAFPMDHFRGRIFGRPEDDDIVYRTTTTLNIRNGPGAQHAMIEGSPLPPNTPVDVLEERGSWRFVDVLSVVNEVMDLQGWVHGRYLKREG